METSKTFDELLEKKYAQGLTTEEAAILENLVTKDPEKKKSIEAIERLNNKAFSLTSKPSFDSKAAFGKFQSTLEGEGSQKEEAPKTISITRWLSIAASLILVSSLCWYLLKDDSSELISYQTGQNNTEEINLPDGTVITLNKNSSLSYNANFLEEGRNVVLRGEAFFNVAKDKNSPFTITSGNSLTTVLGTSFNIKMEDDKRVRISVMSGKVLFAQKEKPENSVTLVKGQGAYLDPELKLKRASASSNAIAWKAKKLVFRESSLLEVKRDLENYFNIAIELDQSTLKNCLFTSDFDQPELNEILEELKLTIGLSYEKTEKKVYLKGDPCP